MSTLHTLDPLPELTPAQLIFLEDTCKKMSPTTAAVLEMVAKSTTPVTSADVRAATGLSANHVATILTRLRERLLIEAVARGLHQRSTLTFSKKGTTFTIDAARTW